MDEKISSNTYMTRTLTGKLWTLDLSYVDGNFRSATLKKNQDHPTYNPYPYYERMVTMDRADIKEIQELLTSSGV